MPPAPQSPLRIGILGTANIARSFVAGMRPSKSVVVNCVASRNLDKASRFALAMAIPRAYGSYAEWSIRAAQEHGVHLVEGYPYRAQPHALKLKELIGNGAIGRVQTVQAAFGFTVADTTNIRLNRNLAGGALLDAGSYPVSLVRMVSGERATRIHAAARWHPTGVDQTIIGGSDGMIQTTFLNSPPLDRPAPLQLKRGVAWEAAYEAVEIPSCNGFLVEAESFERLMRHGPEHGTGAAPAESLDIAMTLDAIMESAHTGLPVCVDPVTATNE